MLKLTKSLYPHAAILKAAYAFTDRAFVHLDADDTHFLVTIEPKDRANVSTPSESEFENEVIAQAVRLEIESRTRGIREALLARAVESHEDEYEA